MIHSNAAIFNCKDQIIKLTMLNALRGFVFLFEEILEHINFFMNLISVTQILLQFILNNRFVEM